MNRWLLFVAQVAQKLEDIRPLNDILNPRGPAVGMGTSPTTHFELN